jgi:hypothetical protein
MGTPGGAVRFLKTGKVPGPSVAAICHVSEKLKSVIVETALDPLSALSGWATAAEVWLLTTFMLVFVELPSSGSKALSSLYRSIQKHLVSEPALSPIKPPTSSSEVLITRTTA